MTNCDAVRELLAEDGAEAVEIRPDVRSHLEGCPSCSRFLHKLQAIESGLQDLPSEDMPNRVADAILQAVHANGQDTASSERVSGRRYRIGNLLQALGAAARQSLEFGWQQKWVVAGTMAVVMLVVGIGTYSLTPRYTAESVLMIQPPQTQSADPDTVQPNLPADEATLKTEIRVIQSREIASRVIARLDLHEDSEFNPGLRQTNDASGVEVTDESLGPVIDSFLDRLKVKQRGQSRVIAIQFESEDPQKSAAAANAVADFYILARLEAKREATRRATAWLGERVAQLREDVSAKERAIEEYRAQSGFLQGQGGATLTYEQVRELNDQRMLELARLAEAEARLQQANKVLSSPEGIESAIEVLQSPFIRELRDRESLLERELAQLSEEYGAQHPTLINARAELGDLRAEIKREVDRVIQGLRNEVSVSEARVASLGAALRGSEREVADLIQSEVPLRALEREAKASRALLESLLERTRETASQESFQQADASVVSYAGAPKDPNSPGKGMILGSALLGSLSLGLILAFTIGRSKAKFRDRANGHVTSPSPDAIDSIIREGNAGAPSESPT